MISEFSRPVALDRIGRPDRIVTVEAEPSERAALAARMGLPAVERLACTFELRREPGSVIAADGRLSARVVQVCVVSLDEFPAEIDEAFQLRFVPAGSESAEIDLAGPDELSYEGDRIDLGEAVAEQLALALDSFPRKPGVEPPEAGPGAPNPFAGLANLRRH